MIISCVTQGLLQEVYYFLIRANKKVEQGNDRIHRRFGLEEPILLTRHVSQYSKIVSHNLFYLLGSYFFLIGGMPRSLQIFLASAGKISVWRGTVEI